MNLGLRATATFLVTSSLVLGCGAWAFADDAEPTHQLSLADLAKYRAALAGKATADDARSSDTPARVSFKDLWNRPDALTGRRVMIEGRVQRIFRQGPVGSFPALAEIWIASPAGDPFCLVVPQESGTGSSPVNDHDLEGRATPPRIPKLGQTVRFTGTFLKMLRYVAGDGDRLAPLLVGDQPPVPVRETAKAYRASSSSADNVVGRWIGSPTSWLVGLTLALLAAGVLARQHLRILTRRRLAMRPCPRVYSTGLDPLLEFIDPRDDP
jgi:hypothetical protein